MRKGVLGAMLLAALPAAVWGQIPWGSEFQVNAYTTGDQLHPSVASDADGNLFVTWARYDPAFISGDVFARRFDGSGAALDATEFQVSNDTTHNDQPFVASDQGGQAVVIWRNDPSFAVFARQYDASGTPASEFPANTDPTAYQYPGGVASDAIGNVVMTWQSFFQDDSDGVFARRYDAFGAPRSGQFQVNSYTTSGNNGASIASDAYGNFVVAWSTDAQDGSGLGVFVQRYDAAGARQGDEFQANSYTTGAQASPEVASDLSGNFVVVWTGPDGSGRGIFGQRYDGSGTARGGEFRVNTFTTAEQFTPAVSADANGFVVAWSSFGQDNSSDAVMARRYDSGGMSQGGEFLVNSYTTNRQTSPSVASAANGTFVVAWYSLNQDGDGGGVFARRFATDLIFRDGFE